MNNEILLEQIKNFIKYLEQTILYTKIKIGVFITFFTLLSIGTVINNMPILLVLNLLNLFAINSEINGLIKLKFSLKEQRKLRNNTRFKIRMENRKLEEDEMVNNKTNTSITNTNNKINSIKQYNYEDKAKVLTKNMKK